MFLVVVKDDLNIVRHQVGCSMLHLAERTKTHLESCHDESYSVEIHRVKVLTGLDRETCDYPVQVVEQMKDWEKELLGIEGDVLHINGKEIAILF